MHKSPARSLIAVLVLFLAPCFAMAQQAPAQNYAPSLGQSGKDVIWIPTPDDVVERMLRMANTTSADYVVDLGAGDGKIAIAAAKLFNARALGIEYNPDMARFAQNNALKAGVTGRARASPGSAPAFRRVTRASPSPDAPHRSCRPRVAHCPAHPAAASR